MPEGFLVEPKRLSWSDEFGDPIPGFRTLRDVLGYFTTGARFFRFYLRTGLGLVCARPASPRSRLINLRDLARSTLHHAGSFSRFLAIRAAARWFSRLRWQSLHLVECEPFVLAGFLQSTQMNRYSRLMVNYGKRWGRGSQKAKDEDDRLTQGCILVPSIVNSTGAYREH